MEVAYRAAKRANPHAIVAFPGHLVLGRPEQRPAAVLRALSAPGGRQPAAPANNFFHDAVPLNLYRAPDDLVRLHQAFKDIAAALRRRQTDVAARVERHAHRRHVHPVRRPCTPATRSRPPRSSRPRTPSRPWRWRPRVGYERIGFYQMVDDDPCKQSAVWGITRDDGSQRPVAGSLRTAIQSFSGFFAGAIRASGQTAGALGGLARRSKLVHAQLAGLRGRLRPAGQPTGDRAVERRRRAAARARARAWRASALARPAEPDA